MIEVRLQDIAERLGKSITDIARETGLNRNTVTDLYHNKVDGIKFATIEVLCDTYGISLDDLIARKGLNIGAGINSRVIRELRSVSPLYYWHYLKALDSPSAHYFDRGFGKVYAFFVRDGAEIFFDRNELMLCAQSIYRRYEPGGLDEVYTVFRRSCTQINAQHASVSQQTFQAYLTPDVVTFYRRLSDIYADFMGMSAWLDAFDHGFSEEMVEQVVKAQDLSAHEVSVLLSGGEVFPSMLRRIALLKLAEKLLALGDDKNITPNTIEDFVAHDKDARKYLIDYGYAAVDIAGGVIDTAGVLQRDLLAYCAEPEMVAHELGVLRDLRRDHERTVKHILQSHKLRKNPLAFFARINAWRDERDEVNKKVWYLMQKIQIIIAERARIHPAYLRYMLPQEIESVTSGLLTEETLKARYHRSMMISIERGEYKVYEGERAISVQDDLASRYLSYMSYGNI